MASRCSSSPAAIWRPTRNRTRRRYAYYKHTAENLTKAGYAKWEGLVLRKPSSKNLSVATYKSGERAKIAAKYTIIVNAGDQQSDLDGGYAERAYKLPNPFYYLP